MSAITDKIGAWIAGEPVAARSLIAGFLGAAGVAVSYFAGHVEVGSIASGVVAFLAPVLAALSARTRVTPLARKK